MNKDIILSVKNLCTDFIVNKRPVRILKNISFDVRRGKTLSIVGESGCGKSVTVHSITRLTPPNARIYADSVTLQAIKGGEAREYDLSRMKNCGREMRALRGTEIGMIFQDPMASLNPVYTVGSQIIENLREHEKINKKDAMRRAVEMLEKLGIPDPARRVLDYPHQLSGGMKQRVMIAIAMICNPDLLIADEPTTALDVTIQAQIMELMKRLQYELGKTVILITHNMGLVAEMADDVCVMYMGRVVEFGSLEDIFLRPAHPYTQKLLESVPVMGADKNRELVTIPGSTPDPSAPMSGCEFADRCEHCENACRENTIPMFELENGHKARCLKYAGCKEAR